MLEGGLVHLDPVELVVEAEPLLGIDLAVPTLMARSLTTFSSCLNDSSSFLYCSLCPVTLGAHEPVLREEGPVLVVDHVHEVVREVLDDHGVERDDVLSPRK